MSQIIPIYIPTYISDQEYNPSRVLPRLFFYNGLVNCETYFIESGSLNQYGFTIPQTSFPYFDNYNVVTGSFPSDGSRTLLFNNEAASYGLAPTASLYTEYWEDYISLLYNPRTRLLNCSAIIPLADYVKMELNDVVNFRGNYYHLRAINDYSLKDGTCSLQLLGPIISDTLSGPPLPPPTIASSSVSWSYTESAQDGTFTILDNSTTIATLTANGSGNSQISESRVITAQLVPVNYPSSGSVTMSLNVNGGTTLSVTSSANTTISASFTVGASLDYKITGSILWNAPVTYSIDYLVVAGGGGGGTGTGGGGGAGGLKSGSFSIISNQTIPVVVGPGGGTGTNGLPSSISSSFSGFISASGGGFGGFGTTASPFGTGSVGGSGGGGTGGGPLTIISGSLGIPTEGNRGGFGRQQTGNNQGAGGGGGASQNGIDCIVSNPGGAGAGGSGSFWVNGIAYAGGGGGWYSGTGDRAGVGGIGGGGRGAGDGAAAAVTGSANTGGGGGGGSSSGIYIAKAGGSGVVILRYSSSLGQIGNGGQVLNSGSFIYHTFTGSANFTT
jgi:hypothetical protein